MKKNWKVSTELKGRERERERERKREGKGKRQQLWKYQKLLPPLATRALGQYIKVFNSEDFILQQRRRAICVCVRVYMCVCVYIFWFEGLPRGKQIFRLKTEALKGSYILSLSLSVSLSLSLSRSLSLSLSLYPSLSSLLASRACLSCGCIFDDVFAFFLSTSLEEKI